MGKKAKQIFNDLTHTRYKQWKRKGLAILGILFIGFSLVPIIYANSDSGNIELVAAAFFFILGVSALLVAKYGSNKTVGKYFGNI